MAIDVDSSSPSIVTITNTTSGTTASFTPPAGALLVVAVGAESGNNGDPPAISNSGTALTWTLWKYRDQYSSGGQVGMAAIWTAPVAASSAMTVTATWSFANYGGLKVFVVTGADTASPVGAIGEGSSATNNITPTVYTSTVANSRAFGIAADWSGLGSPSSTDTGFPYHIASHASGIAVHKAANTTSAGSTVTLNFDAAGSSSPTWNWVAVEIVPSTVVAKTATDTATLTEAAPTIATQASDTAVLGEVATAEPGFAPADTGTLAELSSLVVIAGDAAALGEATAVPAQMATTDTAVVDEGTEVEKSDGPVTADTAALGEAAGTAAQTAATDTGALSEATSVAALWVLDGRWTAGLPYTGWAASTPWAEWAAGLPHR